MPIAGTNIPLDTNEGMDKITVTEKVTSPYHSDGNADLTSVITTSLSDTNEKYFFGIFYILHISRKYKKITTILILRIQK